MTNSNDNWFQRVTKKGVEVRREDDIDVDIYWRPLRQFKQSTFTEENDEWVLKLLKDNNFDEKLEYARNNKENKITLYYETLDSSTNIRLLQTQLLNYLSNTVENFKGVIGVADKNGYKSKKSRIDIIIGV